MTNKEITIEDKKIVTTEFRVSFPKVFKAEGFRGSEPKYSLVMLVKKGDKLLNELLRISKNAAIEKWGADKAEKILKQVKGTRNWPFRDGDKEKADVKGYAGHYFISVKSKNRPGLVNQKREAILNEEDFYAGCYARAELIAFAYDNEMAKGVGFSLQNIQKLRDGEKFSGRRDAEDVFDEVEDLSDDPESYANNDDESSYDLGSVEL